jgi:hypothetical protein
MRFFTSIEFKIFITFFLISAIFSYWTSWNEETNFSLTKAIVEEKTFYLNNYVNKTKDILYLNNNYFAFYQRWGLATLSTSAYYFLKLFFNDENSLKFFLTILNSSLFFSLSIIVIYKLSKRFLKIKNWRILICCCYGIATLAFQQSRFLTTHSAETFFAILSFYMFLKVLGDKKFSHIFLLGVFSGYSLSLTIVLRIMPLLFSFILLYRKKLFQTLIFLLVTTLIYIPFLLSYSNLTQVKFENLTLLPSKVDNTHLPFYPKEFKGDKLPLQILIQLLLFPSKGIFFYYPILLLSFFGFFLRPKRIENLFSLLFIILTFFGILIYILIYSYAWWFGWVSYGASRILTVFMPFFLIGLMSFIEKFGFKLIIPFFIFSILANILLLQYGEDKISTLSWEEYKYKMEHFQVLSNPLFEHYLPLTLINGPRSILLENLIIDKKISIDFKHPYNPVTPEFVPPGSPIMKKFEVYLFSLPKIGIVVLRLPWLSLFIVTILLILIWKSEILRKIRIKNWALLLILSLIFLVSFIRVRDFVYGDNWCAPEWNENEKRLDEGRWIGQNATLFLFSKEKVSKVLRLVVESFERNQTLEIYLNGKSIGNYTIEKVREILRPIELKEGSNEILLKSRGDFINPWKIGVSCDTNVSFKISKILIV